MNRLRYLDFELKIEKGEKHYKAIILHSPAGEVSNTFKIPFSNDRLESLILKLGHLRATTRNVHSVEMEAVRELGGKLFEAIFSGEVLASFRSSVDETSRQAGTGLRIKLRLQDVPELADLPWEFLFDPALERFISQSNLTPIVRYIEMPERIKPLKIDLPLQLLVMISSPINRTQLDLKQEKQMLLEALHVLSDQGKVHVRFLEKATLANLQHYLRDDTYHIFHFIGHGEFNKETKEGVLILEDEQELGWAGGAHRIGTILHDHPSLRLAVLNSCEGARNSRTDPFAGVATTLVRQGIPAVVAMQFEITDDAAITFASEFYTALAEGFAVDAAMAEARKAIYAKPNDIEWGTPVLYMRSSDGVLFDPSQESATDQSTIQEFTPIADATIDNQAESVSTITHDDKTNGSHRKLNLVRSIISVIIGYLVIAFAYTALFSIWFQGSVKTLSVEFMLFSLGYGFIFSVIGGYITAKIGKNSEIKHAFVLAIFSLVLGIVFMITANEEVQMPSWYKIAEMVVVGVAAVLGGYLRVRQMIGGMKQSSLDIVT